MLDKGTSVCKGTCQTIQVEARPAPFGRSSVLHRSGRIRAIRLSAGDKAGREEVAGSNAKFD